MAHSPKRFLEQNYRIASSGILAAYRRLPKSHQQEVKRLAIRVLRNHRLRAKNVLRGGTSRFIVALLPESFDLFEDVLSDRSSPFWYEFHFTMFSRLDRSDLTKHDQDWVVSLAKDYLWNTKREAGAAAWKAGDLLGDEWRNRQTLSMLIELAAEARYAAGRKGALHGIEESLYREPQDYRAELLAALRRSAKSDISPRVRRYAQYSLDRLKRRRALRP